MLALKLKRIGKKHQAAYRLVVDEKRHKLFGRVTEDNPHAGSTAFNKERIAYWLSVGAQPTDTVHNLLVRVGILKGPKIAVHKKAKAKTEESLATPVRTAAQTGSTNSPQAGSTDSPQVEKPAEEASKASS